MAAGSSALERAEVSVAALDEVGAQRSALRSLSSSPCTLRLSLKVCMHLWRRAVMCEMWLCSALERTEGNATQNCDDAQ